MYFTVDVFVNRGILWFWTSWRRGLFAILLSNFFSSLHCLSREKEILKRFPSAVMEVLNCHSQKNAAG
jgi:hypothetical protein